RSSTTSPPATATARKRSRRCRRRSSSMWRPRKAGSDRSRPRLNFSDLFRQETTPMAQDTISFAVIGAGMLARSLHLPNLLETDVTTLHTCCDLDEKALQECRAIAPDVQLSTDYRAVIHNPE